MEGEELKFCLFLWNNNELIVFERINGKITLAVKVKDILNGEITKQPKDFIKKLYQSLPHTIPTSQIQANYAKYITHNKKNLLGK